MKNETCANVLFTFKAKVSKSGNTPNRLSAALVAICGDLDYVRTLESGSSTLIREYRLLALTQNHMEEIVKTAKNVSGVDSVEIVDNPFERHEYEAFALTMPQRLSV